MLLGFLMSLHIIHPCMAIGVGEPAGLQSYAYGNRDSLTLMINVLLEVLNAQTRAAEQRNVVVADSRDHILQSLRECCWHLQLESEQHGGHARGGWRIILWYQSVASGCVGIKKFGAGAE